MDSDAKAAKTELFERMPVPKAVLKLIVPTVVSSLVMVFYNLADTLFVGFLNDPAETSAVTLAATVLLAFNAVNNLFGVGASSLISRSMGAGDYETAKRAGAFGFWGAVICGLLFSVLCTVFRPQLLVLLGARSDNLSQTASYLFWTVTLGAVPSILNVVMANIVKSEGMALHAAVGSMTGCLLNIVLDPFFILPQFLGMGAAGAGCATFISNCIACLYFFVMMAVKRRQMVMDIRLKYFTLKKNIVREVCGVGVPASIQNLLNVTGMTVLNNFMAAYGSEAVSAIGIAHKMAMIPMYISLGTGQGVMPLIGYNYTAGNKKRMRDALLYTVKILTGFMLVTTAIYCIFSEQIIRLFMKNELVVAYGSAFLIGQSLAQVFTSIDFTGIGVFQACGMGKKSLVFALLRKVVFEIPALFVLDKLFPMYGLAYAPLVPEVVLAVIAVIEVKKIMKDEKSAETSAPRAN